MIRRTVEGFLADDGPRLAAALSYYTIFSLPPLLVILLAISGTLVDPGAAQGYLEGEIGGLLGVEAGRQVTSMVEHAAVSSRGLSFEAIIGMGALLFGATGAFVQLQGAMNKIWQVEPDPKQGGLRGFLLKRVASFGVILAVAFFLLISLAVSAVLAALEAGLGAALPATATTGVLRVFSLLLSLVVTGALFSALFRLLPDAEISWRDAGVGGGATAILFAVGKLLLGTYLGRTDPGSAFGAAGSLIVILVWIYYSSMIFLLGAEFAQAWATRSGDGIVPEPGAHRVREVRVAQGDARTESRSIKGQPPPG